MGIRNLAQWLLILLLALGGTACSSTALAIAEPGTVAQLDLSTTGEAISIFNTEGSSDVGSGLFMADYDDDDLAVYQTDEVDTLIVLEGDQISFQGNGVSVEGNSVMISRAGSYSISGMLNDGQLVVDTLEEDAVFLLLNGVNIHSSVSAPIDVRNAEKVVITLVEGTENVVTDAESYALADQEDEPNAAIFSNDDLTINGSGSLMVNANYSHGIASDDDLKIISGAITVHAVGDGIKGRDSVAIKDGMVTIVAGSDAIQADNDEDDEKGYVLIEGGQLDLTAALDGVQAETRLVISDGEISISSGGGAPATVVGSEGGMPVSVSTEDTGESTKGLKAGVDLTIAGGSIQIDSLDDSLHSDGDLIVAGGTLELATGDDGLHAESTLMIQGGDLTVTQSYEGIESADIVIRGGTIHVVSSDDGLNASSGDGGGMGGGRAGGGFFESGDNSLVIDGGYLVVDAMGDGFDINGPVTMSGGMVIIIGPIANNNGALDYGGSFDISGGLLVAVGSSGMAQAPSESSSQYSLMYNYTSSQPAGMAIHIEAEDGQEILTFVPWREYASFVFSSPDLEQGASYKIVSGGGSTGDAKDGWYTGGTYTAGQEVATFTVSSVVTVLGSAEGFRGGPGGRGGGG